MHSLLIIFTVVAAISYGVYKKATFQGTGKFSKKVPVALGFLSIVSVLLSLVLGILGSILVGLHFGKFTENSAGIMTGLSRVYSWYSRPVLGFFLYGTPAMTGILIGQLVHRRLGGFFNEFYLITSRIRNKIWSFFLLVFPIRNYDCF